MSKRVFATLFMPIIGLLVLAAGVVACQPNTTEVTQAPLTATATSVPATPTTEPSPTKEPTREPTAIVVPTATPAPAQGDPTPTDEPKTTQEEPSPTPALPWQIPEEREDDWKKGGENAGLIIVEYGDYQ
jgi:hypothetical protein